MPHFSVIAPWASVFPFEFWIIPRIHRFSPVELTEYEVEELASTLQTSLRALASLLSDPPYNLVFHIGPTKARDKLYHWHIEVYPKLATQAGFELGSGMYINTVMPEVAAQALRREEESARS
jgi:UDPglucose--hexose-1-phosphate uridylyltransferase